MPFYDYKCPQCNDKIAISHPMTHTPTIYCGKCATPRVKVPAVGGVAFKGGGWGSSSN